MRAAERFGLPARSLALAVLVLLAAASLSACGGGGDSSSSTPAPKVEQAEAAAQAKAHNEQVRKEYRERRRAEAPTADERQAKKTAVSFYAILGEEKGGKEGTSFDSAAFCELMSKQAQEQTIAYAEQESGVKREWNCEKAIELLVELSKRAGGFKGIRKAKVLGVNAVGDRATASIRFGKGPVTSIPLVKEGGEWKLAASPAKSGSGG